MKLLSPIRKKVFPTELELDSDHRSPTPIKMGEQDHDNCTINSSQSERDPLNSRILMSTVSVISSSSTSVPGHSIVDGLDHPILQVDIGEAPLSPPSFPPPPPPLAPPPDDLNALLESLLKSGMISRDASSCYSSPASTPLRTPCLASTVCQCPVTQEEA